VATDPDHGPRDDAARAVSLSDDFAPWAGRPGVTLYLRPLGLGDAAPGALPLAGGPLTFDRVELILRWESPSPSHSLSRMDPSLSPRRGEAGRGASPLPRGEVGTASAVPGEGAAPAHPPFEILRAVVDLDTLRYWAARHGLTAAVDDRLDRLSRPRDPFAGLGLGRPRLMGIVNVTPDSFSDGGDFADAGRAVAQGLALAEAGAEILDIGGESTRPGSAAVSPEEEIARIEPVIRDLANRGLAVSVDTRHAAVMQAALAAGARIVNDVTGLTGDPASLGPSALTQPAASLTTIPLDSVPPRHHAASLHCRRTPTGVTISAPRGRHLLPAVGGVMLTCLVLAFASYRLSRLPVAREGW